MSQSYTSHTPASSTLNCFSLFSEKICQASSNPSKNLQLLSSFKEATYKAIDSPEHFLHIINKLNESPSPKIHLSNENEIPYAQRDLISPTHTPTRFTTPPKRNNTTTPVNRFSAPLNFTASPSFTQSTSQTTYQVEPFSTFLNRVVDYYHPDSENITKLGNRFNSARILPEREETIFNALCCCFFEKLMSLDAEGLFHSPIRGMFGTEEWVKSQNFLFTTLLKGLGQDPTNPNRMHKFYEALSRDTNLYQKGVAAFKEIIEKILWQVGSTDSFQFLVFFKWMNEFDFLTKEVLKKLAQTLQTNLRIITLTGLAIKEEVYAPEGVSFGNKTESVIFYNKLKEKAYLLFSDQGVPNSFLLPEQSEIPTTNVRAAVSLENSKIETKITPSSLGYFNLPLIKEDEIEMRYGTLQNAKQKVNHEYQPADKNQMYSIPVPMEITSNIKSPLIELGLGYDNIEKHHQQEIRSPISSNWLSKDSFSDLPSYHDGPLEMENKVNRPTLPVSSPLHSIPFVKSASDPIHSGFPFTPKPQIFPREDIFEGFGKVLQVQTPNRYTSKHFDIFSSVQKGTKEMLFGVSPFKKEERLPEIPATKLSESVTTQLSKINRKLTSNNPEFENVAGGWVKLNETKAGKVWDLDPLVKKYEQLLSKKGECSPAFQPLAAMRMDE